MSLHNVIFHWQMSGFMLLTVLAYSAEGCRLRGENVKKCIRMGITVLKIVVCKLCFIALLMRRCETKFPTKKNDNLLPQIATLKTVIPLVVSLKMR